MKSLFHTLLVGIYLSGLGSLLFAQETEVPSVINFNGTLYDPGANGGSGGPMTGNRNLIFRLYDTASGGSPLWARQFPVFLKDNGSFNLLLNDVAIIPPGSPTETMAEVFTSATGPLYLSLEVVDEGGELPRRPLGSAPFAYVVNHTEEAEVANLSTLADRGEALEVVNASATDGGFAIVTQTDTNRVVRIDAQGLDSSQELGMNLASTNRVEVAGGLKVDGGMMSTVINIANPSADNDNNAGTPESWTNNVGDGFVYVQSKGEDVTVQIDGGTVHTVESSGFQPGSNTLGNASGLFPVSRGSTVVFQVIRLETSTFGADSDIHFIQFNSP